MSNKKPEGHKVDIDYVNGDFLKPLGLRPKPHIPVQRSEADILTAVSIFARRPSPAPVTDLASQSSSANTNNLGKIDLLKKTKYQLQDAGDLLYNTAIFAHEQQSEKVDYANIYHALEEARKNYQLAYIIDQTLISMTEKPSFAASMSLGGTSLSLDTYNYPDRLSNIESLQRILKVQMQSQNALRARAYLDASALEATTEFSQPTDLAGSCSNPKDKERGFVLNQYKAGLAATELPRQQRHQELRTFFNPPNPIKSVCP